jgi:tetratricopeptide (TPR) repeat protein
LRGGDVDKAIPHSIAGSESALQSGAPLEAERVLKAISPERTYESGDLQIGVLLAKALVNQSKANAALPILTTILENQSLRERQRAEVLYLRTAAEYLRGHDGTRYREFATEALGAALEVAEADIIARSAFEYARSGVVAGDAPRIRQAVCQIDRALEHVELQHGPMMYHARCYARFFCHDAFAALEDIEKALHLHRGSPNIVEEALLHNAHGVCLRSVCRTGDAQEAFETALALSLRVGDDSRASIVSANLGMVENSRGAFESGLAHGKRALEYARSDVNQPLRTIVYTTLMESCALVGRTDQARRWMESARESIIDSPTMINRLTFYLEAAGFALMIGNIQMALDLIEQAECAVQGQDLFPQDAGMFARYRAFRAVHVQGVGPALEIVTTAAQRFEKAHPLYYINLLPAKAWLERKVSGCYSKETDDCLNSLSAYGLNGTRATWTAQGFLE